MQKLEITGDLDKGWIVTLISEGYSTYDIFCNYSLSEDLILECSDLLDKSVVIQGFDFTEEFVLQAIEIEYLELEDIKELSMKSYSNFSPEFISKYKSYINWNRMILYISTQSCSFEEYVDIINNEDLWEVISANDLPTDFIRQWKDKLNWNYLSIVKQFSDEEKQEFADYIVIPVEQEMNENPLVSPDVFKFSDKLSPEELEDLIIQIQNALTQY